MMGSEVAERWGAKAIIRVTSHIGRDGCRPKAPVGEGGPTALEGTLSPLPTLEDSLPPLLGLRPATRRKYPPGPPSKIRLLRWGEPTGLVPRGSGARGGFSPHRALEFPLFIYLNLIYGLPYDNVSPRIHSF